MDREQHISAEHFALTKKWTKKCTQKASELEWKLKSEWSRQASSMEAVLIC